MSWFGEYLFCDMSECLHAFMFIRAKLYKKWIEKSTLQILSVVIVVWSTITNCLFLVPSQGRVRNYYYVYLWDRDVNTSEFDVTFHILSLVHIVVLIWCVLKNFSFSAFLCFRHLSHSSIVRFVPEGASCGRNQYCFHQQCVPPNVSIRSRCPSGPVNKYTEDGQISVRNVTCSDQGVSHLSTSISLCFCHHFPKAAGRISCSCSFPIMLVKF